MEIKYNFALARFTSYKIGGSAKIYIRPKNLEELKLFLQDLSSQDQLLWLGLGSNILIRDHGFAGVVIHSRNTLNDCTIIDQNHQGIMIKAGAGVTCSSIAKFCVKNNLEGGIWFAGIPGTIGGALQMNAGAFGGETWDSVRAVEVINRFGEISQRFPEDYTISYRSVLKKNLPNNLNEWFVSANLFFNYNRSDDLNQPQVGLSYKLNQLLIARRATQPIGTLNCGSVFKNPPNNSAGKLIDGANLKGRRCGEAMISPQHANFIINLGQATASDVEALINLMQQEVWAKYNVWLEPEVKIIGNV